VLKELPPHLARELDSVSLTFSLEQFLVNDLPAVQNWQVSAVVHHWADEQDELDDPTEEVIARINLVKGNLTHVSLLSQLDAVEGDLEMVGGVLLDEDGDLADEVADELAGVGSQLLILNSVVLDPRWRGHGVGAYLAGEAIAVLDSDAHCVATYPAPLDGSEGRARSHAVRKLGRVWSSIGFTPFRDGVWVLDPGLVTLSDALERMRLNFGIS
jgi:GNAT superfamily N-acetyltransferase